MTSLRETAEKAANRFLLCHCDEAYKSRGLTQPDCPRCNYAADIADEIERVAKEFAEKALEQVIWHGKANSGLFMAGATIPKRKGLYGLGYGSEKEAREHCKWAIAESIAAAEKE